MDDAFLGHHKTRRALRVGPEALVMWCALRTYVAVNLSNGEIPDEDIDDLPHAPKNPRKWLMVLVECGKPNGDGTRGAGLVDQIPGGWRLHHFEHHGEMKDQVERRREKARERQRKLREQRESRPGNEQPTSGKHRVTNSVSNGVTNAGSHEPPSHPIPSHPEDPTDPPSQRPDRLEPKSSPSVGGRVESNEKIRCPVDLELLSSQQDSLEMMPGIPRWAIAKLTGTIRAQLVGRTDLEMPLKSWRNYLSKSICSEWSDINKRPTKDPEKPIDETGYGAAEEWA